MQSVLIGLDVGTTVCKSVLFDEALHIIGSAEQEIPLITISGSEIEQDANLWWEVTKNLVKKSLKKAGIQPGLVKGMSISAQGISFVPVDRACTPLRNALSWLDTRAKEQRNRLLQVFDEKSLFSITGKRVSEAYVLSKLLWVKEWEPRLYARTYKFVMALDFVIAKLCGEFVTDHTMASGTLFYDITEQTWSSKILESFDLDADKLPEIVWSGTPVGTLTPVVAEELGLRPDVVVAVGGQDQKVAALGAGIDVDRTTVSLGTAMAITQKCERPVIDEYMRIPCFTDLLKHHWVIEGSSIGCSVLDWLKHTFFPQKSYAELNQMAMQADTKNHRIFLYPYFAGASSLHYNQDIRGFLYGLGLNTKADQIVRSVFEGIAYQIKENIDVVEEMYKPVQELRVFGGGSKSEIWCQIIADITSTPVAALYTPEAASVGAAILAGLGAGVFSSPQEAFESIIVKNVFEPQKDAVENYKNQYQHYLAIQKKVMG
jgi:xylulokinase